MFYCKEMKALDSNNAVYIKEIEKIHACLYSYSNNILESMI